MERSKKELDHHITSLTGIHSKNSRFYWEAVVYFLELKSKVDEEKDRQVKTAMRNLNFHHLDYSVFEYELCLARKKRLKF